MIYNSIDLIQEIIFFKELLQYIKKNYPNNQRITTLVNSTLKKLKDLQKEILQN